MTTPEFEQVLQQQAPPADDSQRNATMDVVATAVDSIDAGLDIFDLAGALVELLSGLG